MKELSISADRQICLRAVCKTVIDSKQWLTEVDSKIGDGDHGIGMAGGNGKSQRRPCGQSAVCGHQYGF